MKVQTKDVVVDKNLYPRNQSYWITEVKYAEALKSGARFPPIELAERNNQLVLIDGLHRLNAHKLNKADNIEANITKGLSDAEIFAKAVELNSRHGQTLSADEITKAILKFQKFGFKPITISELLSMRIEKIEPFIKKRTITDMATGETIVLKKPLQQVTSQQQVTEVDTETLGGYSQVKLLADLITLFKNKWIQDTPQIKELIAELYKLLTAYIQTYAETYAR